MYWETTANSANQRMKSVIFSLDLESNRVPIVDKNFKPAPLEIRVRENYSLAIIRLFAETVGSWNANTCCKFFCFFFYTVIYIPAATCAFFLTL